ncbi:MAG: hypothetical protein IJ193_06705 [Bacilli bacterium]|nr:hypothetical protein [Bacilli bacterium]
MVAYVIGIFFIIAGLMMWPYGFGPIAVGVAICAIKFFGKYGSVDNYNWTKTFEKSSIVNEFIQMINEKNPKVIEVKRKYFSIDDEDAIMFQSKGISDLSIKNCETLATTIKNGIINGSKYDLQPIYEYTSSGGGYHSSRPIGMTQTANGNFVFDYGSDGPSTEIVGYHLVLKADKSKVVKKTSKRLEWK